MSGVVGSYNIRGSGLVKKITASGFADNAITLAKMAGGTDGNIISYDASGNPVAIATGSDGQVLTSTGAGSPPAMESVSGGGKLGQFVVTQNNSPSTISTTSSDWVSMGISVAITPVAATSKIYLKFDSGVCVSEDAGGNNIMQFYRGASALGAGTYGMVSHDEVAFAPAEMSWVDFPETTSETTYYVYIQARNGEDTFYVVFGTSYYQLSAWEILA